MKKSIVLLILVLSPVFSVGQNLGKHKRYRPAFLLPAIVGSVEERWEKDMFLRMKEIEKVSGITFAEDWVPRVQFGIPSYIQYPEQFPGCYDPDTRSFFINPLLVDRKDRLMQELMDHELGHALADQVSYCIRGCQWPDEKDRKSLVDSEAVATKVLSEGVAEYFANLFYQNVKTGPDWLPSGYGFEQMNIWQSNTWQYDGGYWLVKPVIEKFGEKGLEYIVTHKFSYENGDVRSAAIFYQKNALEELARR